MNQQIKTTKISEAKAYNKYPIKMTSSNTMTQQKQSAETWCNNKKEKHGNKEGDKDTIRCQRKNKKQNKEKITKQNKEKMNKTNKQTNKRVAVRSIKASNITLQSVWLFSIFALQACTAAPHSHLIYARTTLLHDTYTQCERMSSYTQTYNGTLTCLASRMYDDLMQQAPDQEGIWYRSTSATRCYKPMRLAGAALVIKGMRDGQAKVRMCDKYIRYLHEKTDDTQMVAMDYPAQQTDTFYERMGYTMRLYRGQLAATAQMPGSRHHYALEALHTKRLIKNGYQSTMVLVGGTDHTTVPNMPRAHMQWDGAFDWAKLSLLACLGIVTWLHGAYADLAQTVRAAKDKVTLYLDAQTTLAMMCKMPEEYVAAMADMTTGDEMTMSARVVLGSVPVDSYNDVLGSYRIKHQGNAISEVNRPLSNISQPVFQPALEDLQADWLTKRHVTTLQEYMRLGDLGGTRGHMGAYVHLVAEACAQKADMQAWAIRAGALAAITDAAEPDDIYYTSHVADVGVVSTLMDLVSLLKTNDMQCLHLHTGAATAQLTDKQLVALVVLTNPALLSIKNVEVVPWAALKPTRIYMCESEAYRWRACAALANTMTWAAIRPHLRMVGMWLASYASTSMEARVTYENAYTDMYARDIQYIRDDGVHLPHLTKTTLRLPAPTAGVTMLGLDCFVPTIMPHDAPNTIQTDMATCRTVAAIMAARQSSLLYQMSHLIHDAACISGGEHEEPQALAAMVHHLAYGTHNLVPQDPSVSPGWTVGAMDADIEHALLAMSRTAYHTASDSTQQEDTVANDICTNLGWVDGILQAEMKLDVAHINQTCNTYVDTIAMGLIPTRMCYVKGKRHYLRGNAVSNIRYEEHSSVCIGRIVYLARAGDPKIVKRYARYRRRKLTWNHVYNDGLVSVCNIRTEHNQKDETPVPTHPTLNTAREEHHYQRDCDRQQKGNRHYPHAGVTTLGEGTPEIEALKSYTAEKSDRSASATALLQTTVDPVKQGVYDQAVVARENLLQDRSVEARVQEHAPMLAAPVPKTGPEAIQAPILTADITHKTDAPVIQVTATQPRSEEQPKPAAHVAMSGDQYFATVGPKKKRGARR